MDRGDYSPPISEVDDRVVVQSAWRVNPAPQCALHPPPPSSPPHLPVFLLLFTRVACVTSSAVGRTFVPHDFVVLYRRLYLVSCFTLHSRIQAISAAGISSACARQISPTTGKRFRYLAILLSAGCCAIRGRSRYVFCTALKPFPSGKFP